MDQTITAEALRQAFQQLTICLAAESDISFNRLAKLLTMASSNPTLEPAARSLLLHTATAVRHTQGAFDVAVEERVAGPVAITN